MKKHTVKFKTDEELLTKPLTLKLILETKNPEKIVE